MNVHVMAAIRIGDIRPHVGDVVRLPLYSVGIQYIPGFEHDYVDQLFHIGKGLDVVRRHVRKDHPFGRGHALSGFLQFPQLFLDALAHADVGQLSRKHRRREKHEHLFCGQFGPVGRARSVKHRSGRSRLADRLGAATWITA